MVSLAKVIDLPLDDAEAFLVFEQHAREDMERRISDSHPEASLSPYRLPYMAHVQQAAFECGVEGLSGWTISPPIGEDEFQRFEGDLLAVTTRLKFRIARRVRSESLEPDASDRQKIKFRVQQLRDEIKETKLSQAKKDELYSKLDELVAEFEGTRVNRGKVLAIITAVAALLSQAQGVVLKGPETVVAIMDTIHMVIGKEDERRALLERYRKPLAIEHKALETKPPAVTGPREDFSADLDDELPF